MKLLFLTKYDEEGPSSRYRSYNYKKFFIKESIECEYNPLFYKGYVTDLYEGKKTKAKNIVLLFSKNVICFKK